MRLFPLLLVLCTTSLTSAVNPCPLLGPIYPPPRDLSHDATFSAALRNITATIQDAVNSEKLSSDSISMQIFDGSDPGSLLSLSYTADAINTTLGVSKVDENTIFRIGSTSKLWTMLLMLIEDGFTPLHDPVARYIPELRQAVLDLARNSSKSQNGIDFTKWNEVTVGELATHLAGIARDCKLLPMPCLECPGYSFKAAPLTVSLDGVLDLTEKAPMLEQLGFPSLPKAQIPPCGVPNPCTRKGRSMVFPYLNLFSLTNALAEFFNGLLQSHPTVPTSSTPIYSNAAYQILAYALEAMTGQTYQDILEKDLLKPLNLTRTFYSTPDISLGVIPSSGGQQYWNFAMGDETP